MLILSWPVCMITPIRCVSLRRFQRCAIRHGFVLEIDRFESLNGEKFPAYGGIWASSKGCFNIHLITMTVAGARPTLLVLARAAVFHKFSRIPASLRVATTD